MLEMSNFSELNRGILEKLNVFGGLSVDFVEDGLVMFKPDCTRDTINSFTERCGEVGLVLASCRYDLQLQNEDVRACFAPPYDVEYVKYLTEGTTTVAIYSGFDAVEKLRWIKREVRFELGVNGDDMRNFIHTAEDGTEIAIQYGHFFPRRRRKAWSDLFVLWHPSQKTQFVEKLSNNRFLRWVGIGVLYEEIGQFLHEFVNGPTFGLSQLLAVSICVNGTRYTCLPTPHKAGIVFEGKSPKKLVERIREDGGIVSFDPFGSNFWQLPHSDPSPNTDYKGHVSSVAEAWKRHITQVFPLVNSIRGYGPDVGFVFSDAAWSVSEDLGIVVWGGSGAADGLGRYTMGRTSFFNFFSRFGDL